HRLAQAEIRNTQLVDQLSRVQEEERVELSRNLHDEVSPLLFSVDVDATAIKQLAATGVVEGVSDKAKAIQSAVQAMKGNVRAIIEQLRPVEMDPDEMGPDGWRAAIGEMLEFWQLRFPDVSFRMELSDIACPPPIGVVVRYLTNEGIGNALKHGTPKRIAVTIVQRAGAIEAMVRDDGGGIRPGGGRSGYGVVGMRERVVRAGGKFELREVVEPPGVEVRALFPVAASIAGHDLDRLHGAHA
ncbi:MAG: histidine kinase, partial [Hyphomicrobium sp.]